MYNVKISSKHQITIGKEAFEAAGFHAGDIVTVRATGPGRVEVVNMTSVLKKYSGCLSSGGELRRVIEEMRDEWD